MNEILWKLLFIVFFAFSSGLLHVLNFTKEEKTFQLVKAIVYLKKTDVIWEYSITAILLCIMIKTMWICALALFITSRYYVYKQKLTYDIHHFEYIVKQLEDKGILEKKQYESETWPI